MSVSGSGSAMPRRLAATTHYTQYMKNKDTYRRSKVCNQQSSATSYLYYHCDGCDARWHCPVNIKSFHKKSNSCFFIWKCFIIQTPQKGQLSCEWMQCKKVLHFWASYPIRHICPKVSIFGLQQVKQNTSVMALSKQRHA